MSTAQPGDTVHVHYTGTLDDGSEFDSSRGRDPLIFTLGSGQVVPGFDAAVTGMAVGEQKTVTLPAAQAYGDPRPELVLRVPRDQFPAGMEIDIGTRLQVGRGGQAFPVTVVEIDGDTVVLDANHRLAGEDLTFALELTKVEDRK